MFPVHVTEMVPAVSASCPGSGLNEPNASEAVTLQVAAGESVIRSVASQGGSLKTFLHLASAGTYQLSIWSEDGKLLYRQMMQEQAGDPATDIAFGTHPHGIYVLTLSGPEVRNSREFVY